MPEIYSAPKKKHTTAKHKKHASMRQHSDVLKHAHSSMNPLAAYWPLPPGVSFDVQHDDEEILLMLRQHPIVNVGWMFLTIVLILLPFGIFFVFPQFFILPLTFQRVLLMAWYLVTFGFALERFIMWYYNIYIITSERVIDVDFYSLLFKRVSETQHDNIEDITGASGGVVQSIFDYGDVIIQTAAEVPEIEFEKVPHPGTVSKLLSELMALAKNNT